MRPDQLCCVEQKLAAILFDITALEGARGAATKDLYDRVQRIGQHGSSHVIRGARAEAEGATHAERVEQGASWIGVDGEATAREGGVHGYQVRGAAADDGHGGGDG